MLLQMGKNVGPGLGLAAFDDTLPQVVLYCSTEIIVATEALQGFEPNPTNMTNFCQSAGWWLQQ